MKHILNIILLFTLLSATSGFAQSSEGEYMQVAAERVTVDDKRCYLIKRYSRKDTIKWDPFCGEFSNFYYEEGYPYKLYVEKYDPHADTIHVIKTIGDSPDPYMKQKELRRKKAKRDSIKAASESPVTEPDNKEKK